MYDLIVIGGGVNGTGIARDAAMRGYRTLLVEKRDFAAGSSGANSGMIHGGVRYLRHDRHVTELACIDSGYIQKIAPHLLFRIPFLFPLRAVDPAKPSVRERLYRYAVEVYLGIYDRYQPLKAGKESVILSPEEAYELEPNLARDLVGAVSFDEWGIDPFRLCVANARSAKAHGADLLTYAKVVAFTRGEGGRVTGIVVRDEASGRELRYEGRAVMNAGGPWAPKVAALAGIELKLRPGKGVHLTLDRRVSNYGVICEAADGREVFVIPHEQTAIIGTTDDDFYGDPDDLRVKEDEVKYLWQAAERSLPAVAHARILRAWAGVRPTVWEYGKTEDALSREHEIHDHAEQGAAGFLSLVGGKLASFRIMSEEAVDAVERVLGEDHRACTTHLEALPGGEALPDPALLAKEARIPESTAARLVYRHGREAERICELVRADPRLVAPVCRCEQVIAAELVWSIRKEEGRRLLDLRRRTRLAMGPCQGTDCAAQAAAILAREAGLSVSEYHKELYDLLQVRWKGNRAVLDGDGLAQEELSRGLHLASGALGNASMRPGESAPAFGAFRDAALGRGSEPAASTALGATRRGRAPE
ncbi:FAD-dependent oxidoreductase [Vulgatibacter incomptus]|uniref:Glycerol-3-phosphate dehydrogenase n=1 Tax=Vulgatibacter incomptus TaxID=1391653 RepID=A0A0K1P9V9_9BACT|nr:FAD-dependent oxidoreductase [Vulgatibacter incomptus]AKU89904.1 Anaerobic glycerol-3-phosphate dehydrogenase subunit A [Vulgatibacter incomptus]